MAQATSDLSGLTVRIDAIVAAAIDPVIKAIDPLIKANETLTKANAALVKATETLTKANETMIKASAGTIIRARNEVVHTDLSGLHSQILSNVQALCYVNGYFDYGRKIVDMVVFTTQGNCQAKAVCQGDISVAGSVKLTIEEAMIDLRDVSMLLLGKSSYNTGDSYMRFK